MIKKTFISNMYSYVLNNFNVNTTFDKFLISIESNISELFLHEVNNKPFILHIFTYAFIKNL